MFAVASGGSSLSLTIANEQAMNRLVIDLAALIEPGDLITLSGDLGAGKTTLARALIRRLAGDETIEVPSPTFTLMQEYALPRFPLVHADLYRLSGASELGELGFDDLTEGAVVLLEWPDRAASVLPESRLDITITLAPNLGPSHRHLRLTGYGSFAQRAERIGTIRRFLEQSGFGDVERQRVQGDASTRSYERLTRDGRSFILMNAPRRPDGPAVRDGKPYSAIAHLAEDVTPFIAMATALRSRGFSAPEVVRADREAGLVILEDLGLHGVVHGDPPAPIEQRYEVAVDLLAEMHARALPEMVSVTGAPDYRIPDYDIDALLMESELLLDWYLPWRKRPASAEQRAAFIALWRDALAPIIAGARTWVLRDFHSPNLMWLANRHGTARIGLLDFQDAVIGSPAYDVASLLQDARVDVSEMTEIALLSRYTRARRAADPAFDAPDFARHYATMAAQRATKILGIFARLDRRDRKPQYLRHMPRIEAYLQRALQHPALETLAAWYGEHLSKDKAA